MTDKIINDNGEDYPKKLSSMEIEFRDIFKFLKNHRIPFFKVTSITLLVTLLYSTFGRKTWEGYVKIVLTNNEAPRSLLAGKSKIDLSAALGINNVSKLNTEVEILKSPSVLLPVFEFFKEEKRKSGEKLKNQTFSKWFKENLTVKLDRGTTILNLSYRDHNKERIIKVLEKTTQEYQDFPQRNKSNEINREIEYLNEQVKLQNEISRKSSEKVQKFILDNRLTMVDNSSEDKSNSLLSQFNNLQESFSTPNGFQDVLVIKSSLENDLLKVNYLIKEFNKIKNNEKQLYVFAVSLGQQLGGKVASIYEKEISTVNSQIELRKITYKDNDKDLILLKNKKRKLLNLLRTDLQNILGSQLQMIYANKAITDKWSEDVLIKYSEYKRDARKDENILSKLEDNLRVAKLQKAKNANPWDLITEPTIKERPVWPPRKLILFPGGLILGLFLSYFYVLLKEKNFKNLI